MMPEPITDNQRERILHALRRIAHLMDSSYRIPGTRIRFGLDGIVGLLLPGGGDIIGLLVSTYTIAQAHRLGLPKHAIARMIGNVGLDSLVGIVPFLGDIFDVAFKANLRNLKIIEQHQRRIRAPGPPSGLR